MIGICGRGEGLSVLCATKHSRNSWLITQQGYFRFCIRWSNISTEKKHARKHGAHLLIGWYPGSEGKGKSTVG